MNNPKKTKRELEMENPRNLKLEIKRVKNYLTKERKMMVERK